MQTKDCIIGRRSIRKFTSQKVEKETLEGIVGLAAYAPSWKNTQVTRYYAITDQAIKDEIAENCTLGYDGNTRIIKGSQATRDPENPPPTKATIGRFSMPVSPLRHSAWQPTMQASEQ